MPTHVSCTGFALLALGVDQSGAVQAGQERVAQNKARDGSSSRGLDRTALDRCSYHLVTLICFWLAQLALSQASSSALYHVQGIASNTGSLKAIAVTFSCQRHSRRICSAGYHSVRRELARRTAVVPGKWKDISSATEIPFALRNMLCPLRSGQA
jgi:hypothetical protein